MNYFLHFNQKKNKVESDKLFNEYSFEIVNLINKAFETQIISVKNNDSRNWKDHL